MEATETDGVGPGVFQLFTLELILNQSLAPGDVVAIDINVTTLQGPGGNDLLPDLVVPSPPSSVAAAAAVTISGQVCVSTKPVGDLTGDGNVQSGDAVQVLRFLTGQRTADGVDIKKADVTGNGQVDVGDAVNLLRNSAELTIPESSKLGKSPLTTC